MIQNQSIQDPPKKKNNQLWNNGTDKALKMFVKKYGSDWKGISKKMNARHNCQIFTEVRCRERWNFYLKPKTKKINWTEEEDQMLLDSYQKIGNKWLQISRILNNRTPNQIKNRFYSSLRKKLRHLIKFIGKKNSTTIVKSIRPKVLSDIVNQIQEQNHHLIRYIYCFEQKATGLLSEQQKILIEQFIGSILIQNNIYLQHKNANEPLMSKQCIRMTRFQQKNIKKQQPIVKLQAFVKIQEFQNIIFQMQNEPIQRNCQLNSDTDELKNQLNKKQEKNQD